jgi:hypothetical protein
MIDILKMIRYEALNRRAVIDLFKIFKSCEKKLWAEGQH